MSNEQDRNAIFNAVAVAIYAKKERSYSINLGDCERTLQDADKLCFPLVRHVLTCCALIVFVNVHCEVIRYARYGE